MHHPTTAPVTPLSGEWLINLGMYRAMQAAGFTVSPMKSMDGRDGPAWQATLSLGGKKVLFASNDGSGGPDWVESAPAPPMERIAPAREAMQTAIDKLSALPEVITFLKAFEVGVAAYEKDEVKRSAKVADILASAVKVDDEKVANVVATMAEIRSALPGLKKRTAIGVHWAEKAAEFTVFTSVKQAPDTPSTRLKLQQVHAARFEGFQGFIPDLLAGL